MDKEREKEDRRLAYIASYVEHEEMTNSQLQDAVAILVRRELERAKPVVVSVSPSGKI